MKKLILLFILLAVGCVSKPIGGQALWTPEKYWSINTKANMEIDYSQSPSKDYIESSWIVFSDRNNNYTYSEPNGAVEKNINFLEEFYVKEEKGEWLHIIKDNLVGIFFSSTAIDYGWIHKSKLILSQHCLFTSRGKIKRKAMVLNTVSNLQSSERANFNDLDVVKFTNIPSNTISEQYLTVDESKLFEFVYYILKSATDNTGKAYCLVSKKSRIPKNKADREIKIVGWVPQSRLIMWNTRVALEPNWDSEAIQERINGKEVKFFHQKSNARDYKNGKKVDKIHILYEEKIVDDRLDGEWRRFPLLREDKHDKDIITALLMGTMKIDNVDIPLFKKTTTTLNVNGQKHPLLRKVLLMDRKSLADTYDQVMDLLQANTKEEMRDEVYNIWLITLADILGENKNDIEDYSFKEINKILYGLPNIETYLSKEDISIQDIKDPTVFTSEKLNRYMWHIENIEEKLNSIEASGKDHPTAFMSNDVLFFWIETDLLP